MENASIRQPDNRAAALLRKYFTRRTGGRSCRARSARITHCPTACGRLAGVRSLGRGYRLLAVAAAELDGFGSADLRAARRAAMQ